TAAEPLHSGAIPVHSFRTILLWPLALDLPPCTDDKFWNAEPADDRRIAHFVEEQARAVQDDPQWIDVNPLESLGATSSDRRNAYGEYAYFHDFVQSFLYRKRTGSISAPLLVWTMKNLQAARVIFQPRSGTSLRRRIDFSIERAQLYLM